MQFYARRIECKHIVWAGPLVNTSATLMVAEELRGRTCPTCGKAVRKVDFVVFEEPQPTFDEPPAPRNTRNKLKNASSKDVQKTKQHLNRLGAATDGLAAMLKESAVKLAPPDWRATLSQIPVGLLRTYEPNAECIRFKDSAMPAIVFHQGLGSFLFKMNRSILPLFRLGTMKGPATSFVEDRKTRTALQAQAVDTALEFLGVGEPRPKDLVEIPLAAMALEMPLTRTMAAFVLCHEYGHAVLNHADELRSIGSAPKFSLLERSRAMEHEADAWGQDALIGAFTGGDQFEDSLEILDELFESDASFMKQDISLAAPCGALLYFEFLDAVEERLVRHGVDIAAQAAPLSPYRRRARMSGQEGHSTHPSNKDRFQKLYGHLSKHGNFTAHTWVEAFETRLQEITGDLDGFIDRTGAVRGRKLASRIRWGRKAKRKPGSWRDTVDRLDDRDDLRIKLQNALQAVEGQGTYRSLDQNQVGRHLRDLETRAMRHFRKGEHAEAESIFTQILDRGETIESVPLYSMLGASREELGDLDGAIAAHRRCLELIPGSDYAAMSGLYLGNILLHKKNDMDGAEEPLRAATASSIPDVRLHATLSLGTIAHGRDDVENALRLYREVYQQRDTELTMFPEVPAHAALNIGGVLEERGQFTEARKMLEFARDHLADDPRNRAIAERHLRAIRGR